MSIQLDRYLLPKMSFSRRSSLSLSAMSSISQIDRFNRSVCSADHIYTRIKRNAIDTRHQMSFIIRQTQQDIRTQLVFLYPFLLLNYTAFLLSLMCQSEKRDEQNQSGEFVVGAQKT